MLGLHLVPEVDYFLCAMRNHMLAMPDYCNSMKAALRSGSIARGWHATDCLPSPAGCACQSSRQAAQRRPRLRTSNSSTDAAVFCCCRLHCKAAICCCCQRQQVRVLCLQVAALLRLLQRMCASRTPAQQNSKHRRLHRQRLAIPPPRYTHRRMRHKLLTRRNALHTALSCACAACSATCNKQLSIRPLAKLMLQLCLHTAWLLFCPCCVPTSSNTHPHHNSRWLMSHTCTYQQNQLRTC